MQTILEVYRIISDTKIDSGYYFINKYENPYPLKYKGLYLLQKKDFRLAER